MVLAQLALTAARTRPAILGGYYMLAQELGGLAAPLFGALAGIAGIASAFGAVSLAAALLSLLIVLVRGRP